MLSYQITLLTLAFALGIVVGSFLNVLVYRFGSGMRVTGRSKCLSCGKKLKMLMLVPLVSYLFQGGRCVHCKSKISLQYPLVELVTGIVFVLIVWKNSLLGVTVNSAQLMVAIVDVLVWSLLITITVYDLKHKIIPDSFSAAFALLAGLELLLRMHFGMIVLPYLPFLDSVPSWINIAAPIIALPFALIWLLSGGRAMGLGDAKLAWGIGWFLGFAGGVTAIILSFWIAFFPSLSLLLLRSKHFTMKSEIPFAPFLVIGTFVTYVFGLNILSWAF